VGTERAGVNPYVFIVGCPRSGTTLLRRILDAHPQLAITRETHWITQEAVDRPVGPDLLARLATVERFARMEVDQAELERLLARPQPVSYAEFVSAVFDLYGKAHGKRLVGDKVPGYVMEMPHLHRLFPHARFVHLIRDGRDVCSSALDWKRMHSVFAKRPGWEADRVATTALWWEQRVRAGRAAGAQLGDGLYRELRYEALVTDPERTCRALCDFLDVPYSDRMLAFNEGRERDDAALSAKRAWRPITPGLRNWRTEMAGDDAERFEAAAGPLLDELGYERA
jgi:hypothetical protein